MSNFYCAQIIKEKIYGLWRYPKVSKMSGLGNYDNYWKERRAKQKEGGPNIFHLQRADLLFNCLSKQKISSKIFDYGSGLGRQITAISNRFNNCIDFSIVTSDISPECLDILQQSYKTIDLGEQNLDDYLVNNKFDVITAFEVLEHLPDADEQLLRLYSKAKVAFIFSVPNTGYIMHRLRLLFGRFPLQWRAHPGEHVRFWTKKDIYWWLTKYLGIPKDKVKIYTYSGSTYVKTYGPFLGGIFDKGIFCVVLR